MVTSLKSARRQNPVIRHRARGACGPTFLTHTVPSTTWGNPGAYGFTDVSDPCAFFFYSQTCYGNPSGYLFWDGIHPTTQGHQMLARLALAEIPEPETLLLLAIGIIGIVVTRRKAA